MARSIEEIKNDITREFMRNESAARLYGFPAGSSFGDHFSDAGIEGILFYVWAVCAWVVEQLMDVHRKEVSARIEEIIPHRPKWYRDKVLAFMADRVLEPDSDIYDTSGMTQEEIEAARVVRHAVATESRDASLLTIKVAGEDGGERRPLDAERERQLKAYISEIKDAGVRVSLVNMEPDTFCCTVDVYYDAILQAAAVKAGCEEAIRSYIENLPFNGEYTNMALVDRLQEVEGVRIAEMKGSTSRAANEETVTLIDARLTPAAGYFRPGSITVNMRAYDGLG